MAMSLSLATLSLGSGGGAAASAAIAWPFSFAITRDKAGFGSSTIEGQETGTRSPTIFNRIVSDTTGGTYYSPGATPPASGGVMVANRGVGGTTATTVAAAVAAAAARLKAADLIVQLGGNYETSTNPIPTIITKAAEIQTSAGHARIIHVPKHNDSASIAQSGNVDWHRLRRLVRDLAAVYPGRVADAALVFRNATPVDAADTAAQLLDQIPPSQAADAAHPNTTGNITIARNAYEPWADAMEGGIPFVPPQKLLSTASTNQTSGGIVGTILHDSSIADTLTGVTLSVSNSDFSVAIETGAIVLRRATATYLGAGSYTISVTATKAGKARTSLVEVYLGDGAPVGTKRASINNQWMVLEASSVDGVQTTQKLSIAIGIKPVNTWGASTAKGLFTSQLGVSGGISTAVKASANQNIGTTVRNSANVIVVNFDSSTAQGFTVANGLRWYFLCVDLTTAGVATGGGTGKVAIDANTATTAGTATLGETMTLFPGSLSSILNVMFATTVAGGSPADMEVAAVAMWADYVDFTSTTTNRDLVRDASTKASVLGTTRGADGPGVVNGIAPFLWMEGPAANFAAGLNLADTTQRWDMTTRAELSTTP